MTLAARVTFPHAGPTEGLGVRHYSVMPHPRPGFTEIGFHRLDEPQVCGSCGAEVIEARVMERRSPKETVWLFDCPNCGDNLWGTRGHVDASRPAVG